MTTRHHAVAPARRHKREHPATAASPRARRRAPHAARPPRHRGPPGRLQGPPGEGAAAGLRQRGGDPGPGGDGGRAGAPHRPRPRDRRDRRATAGPDPAEATVETFDAVREALENAGIEVLDEGDDLEPVERRAGRPGGPRVRGHGDQRGRRLALPAGHPGHPPAHGRAGGGAGPADRGRGRRGPAAVHPVQPAPGGQHGQALHRAGARP